MKVSIVIVAYNNWPELELALQSALCQSHAPLEVIVVDNSSSDATPREITKRFADRIRYVRQPNTGDAGAYNTGARLAQGEFIQFLDGDDVLAPDKIERQLEVFRLDPGADIVYGDTRLFKTLGDSSRLKDTQTKAEGDLLGVFLETDGDYFGNTAGLLMRRAVLERVGAWDESIFVTDADYWLRALWAGCRFAHCPDALMGFVCVGPGKMSSDATRMLRGQEALWVKALNFVNREPYRGLVLRNLAATRFHLAVRAEGAGLRQSLEKLAQARAADPSAVSLAACGAGAAAVLLPGGRALARAPLLRGLRRAAARLAGFPIPR